MNVDDVFSRLLFSVIRTGLAPRSFYTPVPATGRSRAHYDGLPVDFVAAVIAGVGATSSHGVRTFNVLNHHADDGLSLDVFVDWIEAAGHPVTRVTDYDEWLVLFEARLRELAEEQRQRSSLPVLASLGRPSRADRAPSGSQNFDGAVRALDIGPQTPRLERAYIEKCLDDLALLGLIEKPAQIPVAAD